MPSHARYAPEYRRRMVEMVRARRSPDDLAKEFEPTAQSIRNWVAQAAPDAGRCLDGLTSEERRSLPGCDVRTGCCAKSARYYQKPGPRSRRRPVRCRHGVRIRERESDHAQDYYDGAGCWKSPPGNTTRNARRPRAARQTRNSLHGLTRFMSARTRPTAPLPAFMPNSRPRAFKWGASGWRG